jgi:hypothetical protein
MVICRVKTPENVRQQDLVGLIEEQRERVIDSVTRHRLSYTMGGDDS